MNINYYSKHVYGNEMLYVQDDDLADTIRGLTGKKTIDERDMSNLQALGLSFTKVMN